jgi:hypothetical protein
MSRRPHLYDPPEPLVDALNDALDAMASADLGRDLAAYLAAERLRAAKALDRAYAEAEAFDAARMLECRADEASAEAEEVWTLDDRNKIAGGRR